MYPRNAASPQRVSIGPVVQISDGAVQTSGVTVRVLPFGSTEADGGGTTAYSTDGVVVYTPTQAETNYTSFVLIAKKTGCIPATVTVVTSASDVAGYAGTDQSKITNNTATVNLSGTTIKTATDVETDTQDIQSRLPAALNGGRMDSSVGAYQTGLAPLQPTTAGRTLDVSAGGEAGIDLSNVGSPTTTLNLSGTTIKAVTDGVTVSDKTGFKLASDGLAQVTAWTVAITGNITGNLTGSVGSISGVTFPSNFANLGIDPTGSILLVNTVDELGGNALTANDAGTPIAGIVWDALLSAHTVTGSFGLRVVRSTNSNNQLMLTGSYHAAADIHELQPAVIDNTHFAAGAIDSNALATSAVGEIADGVWDEATSGHTTAGTTGKALIDSGAAGNPWTTDLATGYSGTQAGNILNQVKTNSDLIDDIGINVYPVSASTPERVNGTTITVYKDEQTNVTISTTATLTGLTLRFVAENRAGEDVLVVENAGFAARTATSATLQIPSTLTDEIAVYNWTLRDITTGNSVLARGVLSVQAAASKDA